MTRHPDLTFAAKLGIPADVHIVACGAEKLTHPAPARELYCSSTFQRALAFASGRASLTGDGTAPVFILSAKHGLVHPDQVVAPYDHRLSDMTPTELAAFVERVQVQLFEAGVSRANFHVHGGAVYVEIMRRAAEPFGRVVNFFNPWKEQGTGRGMIGARRGWYRKTAEREQAWRDGLVSDMQVANESGRV